MTVWCESPFNTFFGVVEWFSDCYLTAFHRCQTSTFKSKWFLSTLSQRNFVSQEKLPFENSSLKFLRHLEGFCFYITIFKEPLKEDVRQWVGSHEQIKLSAVLVFIFPMEKKSFFTFKHLKWLYAPKELTKCFHYLVLRILDMLANGLTGGLTSWGLPILLQMFFFERSTALLETKEKYLLVLMACMYECSFWNCVLVGMG